MTARAVRVAVTGGIGSGKSTFARLLADRGAVVVDADVVAREVVQPGTAGLAAVADAFPGVVGADGALDRAALAAVVFADPTARRRLEAIVHPLVAQRSAALLADVAPGGVAVYDVPLLAEAGGRENFDVVVVVRADAEVRVQRLVGRGLPGDDARRRIAAQVSDAEREADADVVVDNDGDPASLEPAADELWAQLAARPGFDPEGPDR